MQSAVRRDLVLIVVLAVIILSLAEFRFSIATRLIIVANQASSTSVNDIPAPPKRRPLYQDDGLDEYGEVFQKEQSPPSTYDPSHPSAIHYHKSSFGKSKHSKHRKPSTSLRSQEIGSKLPLTALVKHSPGFTVLENVYLWNGTLYLVRSDMSPTTFPEKRLMISSGAAMSADASDKEPTDDNMQIIGLEAARKLFGERILRLDGTSFMSNDHPELFTHYYHFSAEILFSLWRTYASLDPDVNAVGRTSLPSPARFIAPHIPADKWRDYASMNQYIFHSALPSTSLEFQHTWQDRAETLRTFVFDRLVLGDRAAAARGDDPQGWEKMSYHAGKITRASDFWWEPIRRNVVSFSGGVANLEMRQASDVVITYVSRQGWGRRMLRDKDHARLVKGLLGLKAKYGWEVNVVKMETLTREDQIALASRSTILMGVHGNGLTSLLWMQPGTAVMEFFYPEGFSYDYLYTAQMVGIQHYAFWNNVTWSYPDVPRKNQYDHRGLVAGFQGTEIPLDADAVIKLCLQRLTRR